MCGRFVYIEINGVWKWIWTYTKKMDPRQLPLVPRYNVAPTTRVAVVRHVDTGTARKPETHDELEGVELSWWLIPRGAKEKGKHPTFNARADTIDEKWSYKSSFRDRRCLIVVDGFYEWPKQPNPDRRPRLIHFANGRPMTLAALWDRAVLAITGEEVDTCTVVTTEANALLEQIPHDRMPVILEGEARDKWLALDTPAAEAKALLVPRSPEGMEMIVTSREFVNFGVDDERCIIAVDP